MDKKIYLFSDNFQGVAIIIFDDADCNIVQKVDGTEVYDLQSNGLLKINGSGRTGLVNEIFYNVDSGGNRTEIPYYTASDLEKNSEKEKIICYNNERGVAQDAITKQEKRFQVMLISSIANLDSISRTRSSKIAAVLP